jgi:NTE family protein
VATTGRWAALSVGLSPGRLPKPDCSRVSSRNRQRWCAIAASTANGFGVPPYGIGDNRYIDGGYRRSSENADLAAGYGRVLVLSPLGGRTRMPLDWGMHLAAQVEELRARGSRVETVLPDSDSRNAFGSNLMDLSTRPPAARAGYDQGRALTGQLTEFWR